MGNQDSPNDTTPLQNNPRDIGYIEPALNGKTGIICWDSWNVRRDGEEYGQ
jgi:hypothetical protein